MIDIHNDTWVTTEYKLYFWLNELESMIKQVQFIKLNRTNESEWRYSLYKSSLNAILPIQFGDETG